MIYFRWVEGSLGVGYCLTVAPWHDISLFGYLPVACYRGLGLPLFHVWRVLTLTVLVTWGAGGT